MRANKRLWRWRRNPLKRRCDVVEAWIVLVTALLMLVGGPTVAVMAGQAVHDAFQEQRQDRRRASAVLAEDAPDRAPVASDRGVDDRGSVTVRWTDRSGSVHTGQARVEPGRAAGTRITVWTDGHGRLVPPPPGPSESVFQAAMVGVVVAGGFCSLVLLGRRALCVPLDRHRAKQWGREWSKVGPRWRHRRT